MITSRWIKWASLIIPGALLSSPAWAHCGKCHEHESACGNPCKTVSHCGSPCKEHVSRCAEHKCTEHVSRCAAKCEKPERPKCARADLERLSGCMPCGSQELTVSYKVETEHASDGQFDLLVDVINDGARVEQFTIPLDSPRKIERDNDREYQATITQTLSNSYPDRRHFRIEGKVVSRDGGGNMDHKTASIHTPSGGGMTYETVTMTEEE